MRLPAVVGIILATAISPGAAWLPGQHKEIYARDGTNLFNNIVLPDVFPKSPKSKRWLPSSGKIRGVSLGSLFVFEPWIAKPAWPAMGCGSYASEFDCVSGLGQTAANAAF